MSQICPGTPIRLFTPDKTRSNSTLTIEAGQRWT